MTEYLAQIAYSLLLHSHVAIMPSEDILGVNIKQIKS
jgi:hypothetical protein